MSTPINLRFSWIHRDYEIQTKSSQVCRITAASLGTLALLMGLLNFWGIPAFSMFGPTGGWMLVGCLGIVGGFSLKSIKKIDLQIK